MSYHTTMSTESTLRAVGQAEAHTGCVLNTKNQESPSPPRSALINLHAFFTLHYAHTRILYGGITTHSMLWFGPRIRVSALTKHKDLYVQSCITKAICLREPSPVVRKPVVTVLSLHLKMFRYIFEYDVRLHSDNEYTLEGYQ